MNAHHTMALESVGFKQKAGNMGLQATGLPPSASGYSPAPDADR